MPKNKKLKNTVIEIHMYSNKMEYLIKLFIWIVSWIGGAYTLRNKTDGVSSAYFVFALSLLMEFAPKIKNKKSTLSRTIHTLFCFAVGSVLIVSSAFLLDNNYDRFWHGFMNAVSVSILGVMAVDCLVLWFSQGAEEKMAINSHDTPEAIHATLVSFNERLMSGNLGNIDGGE